jgi:RNA polymerase sigma-70 factor (ECF subfamily)
LNGAGPEDARDLDAELMARAGEGDRAAWKALYVRHRDRVFRTALRFLAEEPAARDVTQEVFLSLFAHAKSYRPTGTFLSYLRRVTANRCMNVRASAHETRRVQSADAVLREVADQSPDPEARLQHEQTAAAVRAAIVALPPRQRMAVILSRFEGLRGDRCDSRVLNFLSGIAALQGTSGPRALSRARSASFRRLAGFL